MYLEDYLMDERRSWDNGSCDTKIELISWVGQCDLYFTVQ